MFLRALISPAFLGLSLGVLLFSNAHGEPAKHESTHVKAHHRHAGTATSESTRAYKVAMEAMHKNMAQPLSGNANVDFARQMIPHHQAAVDMAKIQLQYGQDERLKSFNRWVIFAQEMEIRFMKHWLHRRDNGAVLHGAKDYYGAAMEAMHHGMMIDYTGDADVDYVRGMIPHHQGAVDMASLLMAHGSDPDLKPLANDVFGTQTQEITWMQRWLTQRAAK